jgi:hypothetical protein
MTPTKVCQVWRNNRDRRQICAVVTRAGSPPVAYGPRARKEITVAGYLQPHAWLAAGDAAELANRIAEFHDLEDFSWYAATPMRSSPGSRRLGLTGETGAAMSFLWDARRLTRPKTDARSCPAVCRCV